MKLLQTTSSLYEHFRCRSSECFYPCCQGWGIRASKQDIAKFDSLPEADRAKILSHIDSDAGLYRMENGRCPFFNREGLCSLILDYGYEYIGEVCDRFPRMDKKIGGRRDLSVEACCAYPALELLSGGPIRFTDEEILDEAGKTLPEPHDPSSALPFELLYTLREFLFACFTTVSGKLPGKLFILLSFTMRTRKLLETDSLTQEAADALIAEYIQDYGSLLEECEGRAADARLRASCFIRFFSFYREAFNRKTLELLETDFPGKLPGLISSPGELLRALGAFSACTRKHYPDSMQNCFLHSLFKYWVHPGEKCFGDHLLGEVAELILLRILSFYDHWRKDKLAPERYALIYSALDRDYAHNEIVRDAILAPVRDSLTIGDYSLFLFPFE